MALAMFKVPVSQLNFISRRSQVRETYVTPSTACWLNKISGKLWVSATSEETKDCEMVRLALVHRWVLTDILKEARVCWRHCNTRVSDVEVFAHSETRIPSKHAIRHPQKTRPLRVTDALHDRLRP